MPDERAVIDHPALDTAALDATVTKLWDGPIEQALIEYVAVPALSPNFDADWAEHGRLVQVVESAAMFARTQMPWARVEVVQIDGRTPLLLLEVEPFGVEAATAGTVLLYGHLDKQPEMTGWRDGLGPWTPTVLVEDGRRRLYGRGGADDGYALYGVVSAICGLRAAGGSHGRLVVMIETYEESGSPDLAAYVEHLEAIIATPDLVVCLDSGAGDDRRLWLTTSLRGLVEIVLTVAVLDEGVHSGEASGVVPSSFRILRQLLDRVEEVESGEVLVRSAWTDIPDWVLRDARVCVDAVGEMPYPFAGATAPMAADPVEQILNRTWRPALSVIAADGLPAVADGGNVLRPFTRLALSLRIPPGVSAAGVAADLQAVLQADPPYAAVVVADQGHDADGWAAPPLTPWLESALMSSSDRVFGEPWCGFGEGGTIPFMAMLGERFPRAQFMVTGVLVPGSNAHGPNEFLDLGYAKDVCRCVAEVLHAHATA